ncbi:MAG: hypothetical protein NTV14_10615 [Coprothermobacterota bacterium]|nr:hypothetical protein [Coprothermobacterota bacterium]
MSQVFPGSITRELKEAFGVHSRSLAVEEQPSLFDLRERQLKGWPNKLIWGDKKLILSNLKNDPLREEIEKQGGLKLVSGEWMTDRVQSGFKLPNAPSVTTAFGATCSGPWHIDRLGSTKQRDGDRNDQIER